MTILRFPRRRQRDPFAGPVTAHSPSFPKAVCSPDRCLNGVACYAPSCYGSSDYGRADTMPAPAVADYDTRIDVKAKAAEVVAQARAEARPPWNTAPQPALPDLLADEAHRLYGWDITAQDVPPRHDRPYIPGVLGAGDRLSPRTAGVSDDLAALPLFRATVQRQVRPCCEQCQQAAGTWQERLYGTYKHHTWEVPEAAPREFGIATELRQAHGETAADADDAEAAFARRYYLTGRAA